MRADRPTVHVMALGGTIAMTGESGSGVRPSLSAAALVAAVPSLDTVAQVSAESFRQVPGASLRLGDIVALARHVGSCGHGGFVVTQGTDTLEETSFAFDLLYSAAPPVVFTGAMRNPTMAGADGAANVLNAVRIAASPVARGQGTLVTFDDTIHAARFLQKGHSSRPSAFQSTSAGALGWVAEDRVRMPLSVRNRVRIDVPEGVELPRVALLTVGLDDDGSMIRAASTAAGLVIQAMGVGHIPDWTVADLAAIAKQKPVVFASRTGAGETHRSTYGFDGSERDLLDNGLIGSGVLDGLKARVLLMLALAAGWDTAAISAAFERLTE